MSYLDWPRINFSGRFFTNVSTINNTLSNYDPTSQVAMQLGWNPRGIAQFKFDSCKVTGVQSSGDNSGLVGASVTTPPQPVPGKLVDLDPDEQNLSQVIGVVLNLKTASGAGFQGVLEPCNLQDMWMRAPVPKGNAGGSRASAIYVSTLNSVQWTDVCDADDVAALKLLQDQTQNSQLAIRFVVGSFFFADPKNPASGFGPLFGSIGPYLNGDPVQFARRRLIPQPLARHQKGGDVVARAAKHRPVHADFEAQGLAQGEAQGLAAAAPPPLPPLQFQACNFQLDTQNCRLSIDLVNSIQVASFAGPPRPVGQLRAVIVAADGSTEEILQQQSFEFTDEINQTQGGIIDVPLTADQCTKLEGQRAGVELQQDSGGDWTTILAEHPSGKFVNITPFTARAVAGESVTFELRAFQWGKALPNETLALTADSTGGTPASLTINDAVTGPDGRADFTFSTPASLDVPGDREELDSLVYIFDGPWTSLNGGLFSTTFQSPDNAILPAGLMVWSPYQYAGMPDPTWQDQVRPIFDEYMRIYPGMQQIMDLTDLSVVQANLQPLLTALSLPFEAPHMMPVTRDLSPQKVAVIITWLKNEMTPQAK